MASVTISVSCGASTASLGSSLRNILLKRGFNVVLDSPADGQNLEDWGVDKSAVVDSAFDDESVHCIVLLDRSYLEDKWFRYRRARLLEVIFRRRGFILPVQVGDDQIDIHGLTHHLGKIRVASGDAEAIANYFLQKITDVEKHITSAFEKPSDFEKVLHQYNENLVLELVDFHVDRGRKIGYEYYQAHDGVTNQNTNFILFFEGTSLSGTVEAIKTRHANLFFGSATVVILPKERSQTRLDVRLSNVTSTF